jgi:hypothetical protein
MMRRLFIGVALLAGLLALIRFFPLSWAAKPVPLATTTYTGTIWNGHVQDVPLLGSVSVKSSLSGIRLQTPSGDIQFSGTVTPTRVKDLILSMPVAQLPTTDARLAGLAGRLSLRIDEGQFADGACETATGQASTDVLAVNRRQFGWAGPTLSGPVDCIDGRLRVRLNGENGSDKITAEVQTGLDGIYQSNISVETRDVAAENALTLFGFQLESGGLYRLIEQGRWR